MAGRYLLQRRGDLGALAYGDRASRPERTTRWRLGRIRHLSLEYYALTPEIGIRHRDGRQQRLGIRVDGILEDRSGWAELHYSTQIHHGDPVSQIGDYAEVMRYEQNRKSEVGLEIAEEIEDLSLDGDIERRDWLIRNQK